MIPEPLNTDGQPFFRRCRFGEMNQREGALVDESLSDGIELKRCDTELHFIVDYYSLENPEEAHSLMFDGERWDDMKQFASFKDFSGKAREIFRIGYRIARLLRRGITVTVLNEEDGATWTLLCANYWRPERCRSLPRKGGRPCK